MNENTVYYVYQLVDPFTDEPFYVGKGSGDRAEQHIKEFDSQNVLKRAKIETLKRKGADPRIEVIHENLTEQDALRLEVSYIRKYKRMTHNKDGKLTNLVLNGSADRIRNKSVVISCLEEICEDIDHFNALSLLLDSRSKKISKNRSLQLPRETLNMLDPICKDNSWTLGWVVQRLIERFVSGHFSGSLEDAIRNNAGPEYGLTRKYTEEHGWVPVPVDNNGVNG